MNDNMVFLWAWTYQFNIMPATTRNEGNFVKNLKCNIAPWIFIFPIYTYIHRSRVLKYAENVNRKLKRLNIDGSYNKLTLKTSLNALLPNIIM